MLFFPAEGVILTLWSSKNPPAVRSFLCLAIPFRPPERQKRAARFLGLSDVQPSERLKARRNRSDSVALSPIHRSILPEVLENPRKPPTPPINPPHRGKQMLCSDGNSGHCFPIIREWTADYLENVSLQLYGVLHVTPRLLTTFHAAGLPGRARTPGCPARYPHCLDFRAHPAPPPRRARTWILTS